jgi:hypothetical protein
LSYRFFAPPFEDPYWLAKFLSGKVGALPRWASIAQYITLPLRQRITAVFSIEIAHPFFLLWLVIKKGSS